MKAVRIAIFAALVALAVAQSTTLTNLIASKEAALQRLATQARSLYNSRCTDLDTCNSLNADCAVHACGNHFPGSRGFQCNSDFGVDTATCGTDSCGQSGLIRSLNTSVVRFPSGVSFTDTEVQAFTCSTKNMQGSFQTEQRAGSLRAWQYIGHSSGSIRVYPGAAQSRNGRSQCTDYDARLRPWYISASSGPKDVILVVDISGSMSAALNPNNRAAGNRMEAAKNAIQALLDTLTQNDRVGIVAFDNQFEYVGGNTIQRATPSHVAALKAAVGNLNYRGGTVFAGAFNLAFDMLARGQGEGENCNKVILFLTDGIAQDDENTILTTIRSGQSRLTGGDAVIFTYSMSSGSDDAKPRAIACANGGVWDKIEDGVDPLTRMRGYFSFLASGINATVPRWSSVYEDAFGLGEMVTAALPVYETLGGTQRLVSVVGTDVTMAELTAAGDNANIVVSQLYTRSSQCQRFSLTECQKQQLRLNSPSQYACPNGPATSSCDSYPVPSCPGASGNLNDRLCDAMRDNSARVVSGTAYSTEEATCCWCDGAGRGRVGQGAPNTPNAAQGSSVAVVAASALVMAIAAVFA